MDKLIGRIMALDLGAKRVGVAFSDPLGLTAQPGPTIERQSDEQLLQKIGELMAEWTVLEAVVGMPLNMNGSRGESFHEGQRMLQKLRDLFPNVAWKFWDERLTTTQAIDALKHAPKKKRQQKGLRDQIAAQLILDSYLRFRSR